MQKNVNIQERKRQIQKRSNYIANIYRKGIYIEIDTIQEKRRKKEYSKELKTALV